MRKGYKEVRSGRVNALIPADKVDTVLNKIRKDIGDLKSESFNSEDVTENYIDIKARLENKRKAEEQYQLLLKKAAAVDEMLKIEQALSEVRSEIESAENKIKYYETQTSMSALQIYLYEPGIEGTPEILSFTNTIKNSFKHGLNGLILVIGAIVIFSISIIPLIPLVYFLWKYAKKLKFQNKKTSQHDGI
jgi:hypothetical protein